MCLGDLAIAVEFGESSYGLAGITDLTSIPWHDISTFAGSPLIGCPIKDVLFFELNVGFVLADTIKVDLPDLTCLGFVKRLVMQR